MVSVLFGRVSLWFSDTWGLSLLVSAGFRQRHQLLVSEAGLVSLEGKSMRFSLFRRCKKISPTNLALVATKLAPQKITDIQSPLNLLQCSQGVRQ